MHNQEIRSSRQQGRIPGLEGPIMVFSTSNGASIGLDGFRWTTAEGRSFTLGVYSLLGGLALLQKLIMHGEKGILLADAIELAILAKHHVECGELPRELQPGDTRNLFLVEIWADSWARDEKAAELGVKLVKSDLRIEEMVKSSVRSEIRFEDLQKDLATARFEMKKVDAAFGEAIAKNAEWQARLGEAHEREAVAVQAKASLEAETQRKVDTLEQALQIRDSMNTEHRRINEELEQRIAASNEEHERTSKNLNDSITDLQRQLGELAQVNKDMNDRLNGNNSFT